MARSLPKWLTQQSWDEIRGRIVSAGIAAATPIAGSVVTAITGFLGSVPTAYVLTAAALVFAGLSHGLLQFNNLLFQTTAKAKLRFGRVIIGQVMSENSAGKRIQAMKIGVEFSSIAIFPIEVSMEQITTFIGGRVNQTKTYSSTVILVDAVGGGWYYDDQVDIAGLDLSQVVECDFSYLFRYGKAGRERKYNLKGKYKVFIKFRSPSEIEGYECRAA